MSASEPPRPSSNVAGIVCMLVFVAILPGLDALTKVLTQSLSAPQILTIRFAFLIAVLAPLAIASPSAGMIRPVGRGLLLVRGVLLGAASIFYVEAIALLNLSTVAAITMLYPIMITAVSPFVLGEKVGVIRMSAVAIGFLGAMIVVRPGFDGIGRGEALALCAPICFTGYALLTRRMAGGASPMGQLIWTCFGALVVVGAVASADWRPINEPLAGFLILAGVFALAIYLLQIGAFSLGEASVVAPFSYLHIVSAAAVGWAIWGEWPDAVAMAGMGLIMAAGVVIAIRS